MQVLSHNMNLLNLHAQSYCKDLFLKRRFHSEQQSIAMINTPIASKSSEQLLLTHTDIPLPKKKHSGISR